MDAVAVTVCVVATFDVRKVTFDEGFPLRTATEVGPVTTLDEYVSLTAIEPAPDPGAAFNVTVAVDVFPPTTVVGEQAKDMIWNGLSVTTTEWDTPP